MNDTIKKQVISGLFWKLIERSGTQGVQFFVQIILARLLSPQEFGLIALITIFITVSNVIVQNGFNTALIQKKEADQTDFSSVFYLSTIVSILVYILLFFAAPTIANFFENTKLINVLRILSLIILLGPLNSIQIAIVSRKMKFKTFFYSSLGGVICSAIVGISLAYSGFGVWALVAQQLTNTTLICIILWFTVKWRPTREFSVERIKQLFSFGSNLLLSSLISSVYQNFSGLIIGKMYSSSMLGYYNRGDQIPNFIVSNINNSITSVMFPALSANQENKQKIKSMTRRSIVTSSFIVFPMMIGLIAISENLVILLLTEKWINAVPFLQLMSLTYLFWPIHTANLQAINALGYSGIFLKLEIMKKSLGLILMLFSIQFGIYALVASTIISSFLSTIINAYPNKRLLEYSFVEQLRDIAPSAILSIVMGLVVYLLNYTNLSLAYTLVIQISSGVIIYFGLSKIFRVESFIYLMSTIANICKK